MTTKELQAAVENWYMSSEPHGSHFSVSGEQYAAFKHIEVVNLNVEWNGKFDVFEVETYTIGEIECEMPFYDPETHEPINRVAVVTIPEEVIAKKEEQLAEAERSCTLFEEFFGLMQTKG